MKKRILSMPLAIVMVVGLVPGFAVTASAAEPEYDGIIGELYYKVDKDNDITTVFGEGSLVQGLASIITSKVIIEEGVTSIGNNDFRGCGSLETLTFMDNVSIVGRNAFEGCYSMSTIDYQVIKEPNSATTLTGVTLYSTNNIPFCGLTPSSSSTPENPTTYTVTVTTSPSVGGSVTGGGTYDKDASVTLTATANAGYSFTTGQRTAVLLALIQATHLSLMNLLSMLPMLP